MLHAPAILLTALLPLVDPPAHAEPAERSAEPAVSPGPEPAAPLAEAPAFRPQEEPAPGPPSARAERDPRGFYLQAFGGFGLLEDDQLNFDDGQGGGFEGEAGFSGGFLAGAAAGWRFHRHWAVELEYTYRTNDVDSGSAGGMELADGGDFASTALLVNLVYHFDTGWRLDPYLGAGFGVATEIDIDLEGPSFPGGRSFSGDTPAAQFLLGAQSRLTDRLDLFVEGRFFRAFDPDMAAEGGAGRVESEYGHYGLIAGLSYTF